MNNETEKHSKRNAEQFFDCYTDRHSCSGWWLEEESCIIDPDTRTATGFEPGHFRSL